MSALSVKSKPINRPARRKPSQAATSDMDLDARRAAAIELLRQWREEGDEEEQRDTFEAIMQGLNEHHSSDRKLFP